MLEGSLFEDLNVEFLSVFKVIIRSSERQPQFSIINNLSLSKSTVIKIISKLKGKNG